MHKRLKVVTERGIEILVVDLAGLSPDEILEIFPEITALSLSKKIRYNIFDITDTQTTAEIKDASKKSIAEVEKVVGRVYISLIGLRGIQKLIANAISKNSYFASDYQDALDWLVKMSK